MLFPVRKEYFDSKLLLRAGTVMVLTTPDANRTMLSYLGTQHEVAINGALEAAISSARVLTIEGYLWEVRLDALR